MGSRVSDTAFGSIFQGRREKLGRGEISSLMSGGRLRGRESKEKHGKQDWNTGQKEKKTKERGERGREPSRCNEREPEPQEKWGHGSADSANRGRSSALSSEMHMGRLLSLWLALVWQTQQLESARSDTRVLFPRIPRHTQDALLYHKKGCCKWKFPPQPSVEKDTFQNTEEGAEGKIKSQEGASVERKTKR